MNTTINTRAFIEAEQYSQFILTVLPTAILPTAFYRDVSDFGAGETLHIKTMGTATIQEVEEDTPLIYNPIETSEVFLSITDYVGDAWYVTDVLRQDGSQIDTLLAQRGVEATRAIQQHFETRYLNVAYTAQVPADPNLVNGFTHRFIGTGTNETMAEIDLINLRLAFDKANIPQAGRVAIVDPVVAATFQTKVIITSDSLNRNPKFQAILENGFDQEHQFVMNLHGWDIWTSNLLTEVPAGTDVDGNVTVAAGVANIFMSILDDNTKPLMNAWRQPPKVEGERNKDRQRDEFVTTARWGVGSQRQDTLGVIVTSATATS